MHTFLKVVAKQNGMIQEIHVKIICEYKKKSINLSKFRSTFSDRESISKFLKAEDFLNSLITIILCKYYKF